MKDLRFVTPFELFFEAEKVLKEVGAQGFFSKPHQRIKRAREGFAAFFYLLALSRGSGRFWWIYQPDESEVPFPDAYIMMVDQDPLSFSFEAIEQVLIPPHYDSYEDALENLNNKFSKGYPPNSNCHLLVFVNHEKSREWVERFASDIGDHKPFKTVTTLHLLSRPGGNKIVGAVVTKLRPLPQEVTSIDMSELGSLPKIPYELFDEDDSGGQKALKFKPEIQKAIRTTLQDLIQKTKADISLTHREEASLRGRLSIKKLILWAISRIKKWGSDSPTKISANRGSGLGGSLR